MRIAVVMAAALGVACQVATPPRAPVPPAAPEVPDTPPAADAPTAPPVRVGTWNLKRLGHGEKRLDLVARIVEQLDVVALQEVMSPEGVEALLEHLSGDWRAVVSETAVGRGRYREHYAVLYRASTVELVRSFTPPDPDDAFERDPQVVCLASGRFDFCLITIHVIYGRTVGPRDHEIRALAALVAALRDGGAERDWIVLGDFNRPGSAPGWPAWRSAGWRFTSADGAVPTTLGKSGYHNPYDHILIDPEATAEWTGDGERLDIVDQICDGDPVWCRKHVSDHAPLQADFATEGPDDD